MQLSRGARRYFHLIEGFIRRTGRAFFASQRWVAAHFGVSIRAVKYWFAELLRGGFVAKTRRANKSSFVTILRRIIALPFAPRTSLPYKDEPTVVNPSTMGRDTDAREPPKVRVERKPMQTALERNDDHPPMTGFEEFFGLFVAAGKPLHKADLGEAQAAWTRLTLEAKRLAFVAARERLMRTLEPRFMPTPARFLQARSWQRDALERTLPYIDPKMDREADKYNEVLRLLKETA
jgi:hypothetical protein